MMTATMNWLTESSSSIGANWNMIGIRYTPAVPELAFLHRQAPAGSVSRQSQQDRIEPKRPRPPGVTILRLRRSDHIYAHSCTEPSESSDRGKTPVPTVALLGKCLA